MRRLPLMINVNTQGTKNTHRTGPQYATNAVIPEQGVSARCPGETLIEARAVVWAGVAVFVYPPSVENG